MFSTLLFLPDLLIVSQTSHSVGTILVIIDDDEHNDDDDNDDDVPDGAAADNNDRNVDAHSWDKNLALSDLLNTSQVSFEIFLQFLELFFYYPVQKLSKIIDFYYRIFNYLLQYLIMRILRMMRDTMGRTRLITLSSQTLTIMYQ